MTSRMKPLLKYPGGKHREIKKLQSIHPELFVDYKTYYEPFLGGGATWLLQPSSKKMVVNDLSSDLIEFYEAVRDRDTNFVSAMETFISLWNKLEKLAHDECDRLYSLEYRISGSALSSNPLLKNDFPFFVNEFKKKIGRIKVCEAKHGALTVEDKQSNVECALKGALYMVIRHLYNGAKANVAFCFVVMRELCFSSMFRFSRSGHFNVPYGGITYNNKDFSKKIIYWMSEEVQTHLANTLIQNLDFEDFFKTHSFDKDDWIFLDPPYDTEFSTYDQNTFDRECQERLASCLREVDAKFLLIVKNTPFVYDLYKEYNVQAVDKSYHVSFMNRNVKDVQHLIITNY